MRTRIGKLNNLIKVDVMKMLHEIRTYVVRGVNTYTSLRIIMTFRR